jgi:hypothetical protein
MFNFSGEYWSPFLVLGSRLVQPGFPGSIRPGRATAAATVYCPIILSFPHALWPPSKVPDAQPSCQFLRQLVSNSLVSLVLFHGTCNACFVNHPRAPMSFADIAWLYRRPAGWPTRLSEGEAASCSANSCQVPFFDASTTISGRATFRMDAGATYLGSFPPAEEAGRCHSGDASVS